MANVIYTVPLAIEAQTAVIALVADNLNAVGPANVYIGGGSANYALVTDGAGNLSWANSIAGSGTVTNVNTSGSGLGFTLTGGPITTTGTVTLTVPSSSTLRTNLTIGNVANLNLNSNTTTFLAGNGAWLVPPGTYSNSNVESYLPTYTGNLSPGNVSVSGNLSANNANVTNTLVSNVANVVTLNATGNISANNANITNVLVSNIANVVTLNATGNISANNANISNVLNANVGNFSGNITSLNANLGNLARASYFQGDGSLLTNLPIPNYANFAGNLINGNTSVRLAANGNVTVNVAGVSNIATFSNTGVNVNGTLSATGNLTVANANLGFLAIADTYVGTIATANQYLISQVGTLSNLAVTGNVSASYYSGNGSLLTGITAVNANFANYAGNVTQSLQPNITSLGTLSSLNVSGTTVLSGNVSATGANVSLGTVANVHITGGNNGYYLQTDGTGNLSWVTGGGSGNGTVGGANTQVQFNDNGIFAGSTSFTFNKNTGNLAVGNVTANKFVGNWSGTDWTSFASMPVPSLLMAFCSNTVNMGSSFTQTGYGTLNGGGSFPYLPANSFPGILQTVSNGTGTLQEFGLVTPICTNSNNSANANLLTYISGSTPANVNIFVNGSAGYGKNPVYAGTGGTTGDGRNLIISTNNNFSTMALHTKTSLSSNSWATTTTTAYANYFPTVLLTTNTGYLALLNQSNNQAISKYLVFNTSGSITTSGNVGTSNNYSRLATNRNVYITASSYKANTLGKYAKQTSLGASFSEFNLPTVTPNATESFAYDVAGATSGNNYNLIISAKDYDSGNSVGNTYVLVSSDNGTTWTATINSDLPTSITHTIGNTFYGIKNYGNGANTGSYYSTDGGNTWVAEGAYLPPQLSQIVCSAFVNSSNNFITPTIYSLGSPNISAYGITQYPSANYTQVGAVNIPVIFSSGGNYGDNGIYKCLGGPNDIYTGYLLIKTGNI